MEQEQTGKDPNNWNELIPLWIRDMAQQIKPETACVILGTRDLDGTVHLYYAGTTVHDMIQISTKIITETEKLGDIEDDPAWEDKP